MGVSRQVDVTGMAVRCLKVTILRVAADTLEGARDVTHKAVYGRQRPLSFTTCVCKLGRLSGSTTPFRPVSAEDPAPKRDPRQQPQRPPVPFRQIGQWREIPRTDRRPYHCANEL